MNIITEYIAPKGDKKYFATYLIPRGLMRAIVSTKIHRASAAEKLHLMLIGIPIPCGVPVEINPPDKSINWQGFYRNSTKGTNRYYIRVNPSPSRCYRDKKKQEDIGSVPHKYIDS